MGVGKQVPIQPAVRGAAITDLAGLSNGCPQNAENGIFTSFGSEAPFLLPWSFGDVPGRFPYHLEQETAPEQAVIHGIGHGLHLSKVSSLEKCRPAHLKSWFVASLLHPIRWLGTWNSSCTYG